MAGAVPEVGADIRGAVASLYRIDGLGRATMAMDWRRCGESEWLGQQASASACASAVLAQPAAECSHSTFNYVAHHDMNCACAPAGARCEVPVRAGAGSYYVGKEGCDPKLDFVRSLLCGAGVAPALAAAARAGDPGWIVQVGAHVGFEDNDPIAEPLLGLLANVSGSMSGAAGRWMLVEASPTNFARLVQNVGTRGRDADYITFLPVNMGVSGPPDPAAGAGEQQENMTFYGISSDVDVDTGHDRRTGKDIAKFVTQMGSFDKNRVFHDINAIRAFSKVGLELRDYVVELPIPVTSMASLLDRHGVAAAGVAVLLIDTEGFDCDIVRSLDLSGTFRPLLVIFEFIHCAPKVEGAVAHLKQAGYDVIKDNVNENMFAVRTS